MTRASMSEALNAPMKQVAGACNQHRKDDAIDDNADADDPGRDFTPLGLVHLVVRISEMNRDATFCERGNRRNGWTIFKDGARTPRRFHEHCSVKGKARDAEQPKPREV